MNGALDSQNVTVNARCSRNGELFGIQFEFRQRIWVAMNAFIIPATPPIVTAPRIASSGPPLHIADKEIQGVIVIGHDYPGCPYCRNGNFFKCHCGHICCNNGAGRYGYCQWCHSGGWLYGEIHSLQGNVQERQMGFATPSVDRTIQSLPIQNALPAVPPRITNPFIPNQQDVRRLKK